MAERRELVMYLNGDFVSQDRGMAVLRESQMQSTGGFYDNERTFGGRVFKLRQHLERLYRGLDYSKIDPGLGMEELEALTMEVLEANLPMLAAGDEFVITEIVSVGPAPSPDGPRDINVVIYCQPLDFSTFARAYSSGVRVVTPATYRAPGQAGGSAATGTSQRVFSLMTGTDGCITECTGANFMFVRDGRIKLPDRINVLPGVSMGTVLELAESVGIAVDEGDYSTHDVYMADEAFVSNTRSCMLPVATINGLTLGAGLPGPATGRLLDAWREMVGVDFVQQALDHLPPEDMDPAAGGG